MKKIFVANWKMSKDFDQTIDFCTRYKKELMQLGTTAQIVLCPSFIAVSSIATIFNNSSIAIGAQGCSAFSSGAYTGQVSALSLKQAGCTFCIIGHSEQRAYLGVTNENIVAQATQLITVGIEPIICIGEDSSAHKRGATTAFLQKQLDPLLPLLHQQSHPITIAYEPIWAIGTGTTPEIAPLAAIFAWLQEIVSPSVRLLYGGSVTPENSATILSLPTVKGLLIGGASLDFKKFEKIVSLQK